MYQDYTATCPSSHGKDGGICLQIRAVALAVETQPRKYMLETINKTKNTESGWDGVNFLIAVLRVLCFRYVAKTMLTAHQHFSYC